MSTNYIAEFYKTTDHNYEDFFGSYVADEKMNKINKEIKSLNEQIDLKKEELSRLYTLRYNDKFTPIEGAFILSYESERGRAQGCRFDILSGAPDDNIICISSEGYLYDYMNSNFMYMDERILPDKSLYTEMGTTWFYILCPSRDEWEDWQTTRKPGDYRKITI